MKAINLLISLSTVLIFTSCELLDSPSIPYTFNLNLYSLSYEQGLATVVVDLYECDEYDNKLATRNIKECSSEIAYEFKANSRTKYIKVRTTTTLKGSNTSSISWCQETFPISRNSNNNIFADLKKNTFEPYEP